MSINFEQVTKRYHGTPVLNDVSLRIEPGEFFVLLGPSGSGKSTLLRIAAGLTDVHHGRISFHGRDVTHVRARDRGVGLVFQHYALFRHMTVGQNVEFALRVRGVRRRERARRRDQLLQLVALEGYASRLPAQLSGGQQQRVAVARALAHEPQVLLLDEPFGALDAKTRVDLRETIHQVQRRLGMTTILVTHDREEAFALGDRIGIMHNGRLLETGRPETLYRRPATRFVATFLGAANLFLGERGAAGLRLGRSLFANPGDLAASAGGHEVITVVRPEDIEVADEADKLESRVLGIGKVVSVDFGGVLERVRVQLDAEWGVVSAVSRDNGTHTAGAAASAGTSGTSGKPGAPAVAAASAAPERATDVIEISRTSTEQTSLALMPNQQVALGVRRFHTLPTPIASFRLLATQAAVAASLRRAPLLRQLVQSMQAPVLAGEEPSDRDRSERDGGSTGVGVIAGGRGSIAALVEAAASGRRWLLCLPPAAAAAEGSLPRRMLIHCEQEAARSETLRLVASIMRHLHAEATFVSVQTPGAPRTEATGAFRRLLDTRAELQQAHGLDIRTEVHVGEPRTWAAQLASGAEPAMVVLGLDGPAERLERTLSTEFAALFSDTSRCAVMLSCTGMASAAAGVPSGTRAATGELLADRASARPGIPA